MALENSTHPKNLWFSFMVPELITLRLSWHHQIIAIFLRIFIFICGYSVPFEPADEMQLVGLQERLRNEPRDAQLLDDVEQVDFSHQLVPAVQKEAVTGS